MIQYKKRTRVLIVLVIGLCIGTTLFHYSPTKQNSINQPAQQSFVSQPIIQYDNYLKNSESNVWNALTNYNITRQECEQRKKELSKNIKKQSKMGKISDVSRTTCDLIRSVLQDFDINPKHINIISWDDYSCAGTNNNTIFVNEKNFNKLSYKSRKFVIGHEIQHMKYQDSLMKEVFEERLKDHVIDSNSPHEPINIYYRFKEERADIQTALKNKEYAQGYVEFVQQKLLGGDNPGISHPKNSKRIRMAQDIVNQLSNKPIQSC